MPPGINWSQLYGSALDGETLHVFSPEAPSPSITTAGFRLAPRQVRHSVVGHLEGEAFVDRRTIFGLGNLQVSQQWEGTPPKNRWKLPFGLRNIHPKFQLRFQGPLGPNLRASVG